MKLTQIPRTLLALSMLTAVSVTPAFGASVSYFLDQSNISGLADGTNYLKVTISDGLGGLIDFSVETLAPLNSIAGPNFGIQTFAFNTTLVSLPPDSALINLPASWSGNVAPPLNSDDGFGKFEFEVTGHGSNRQTVLNFSVNVAGDNINDYYSLSSGTAGEGNSQYVAHVAAFAKQSCGSSTCTSAWFGGGASPVPETDTWGMMLVGLGLVGLQLRRRINGVHRIHA